MAWTDKPTKSQLTAWCSLVRFSMSESLKDAGLEYISKTDRKTLSDELNRVRELYIHHELDSFSAFDAPCWNDFKNDELEAICEEKNLSPIERLRRAREEMRQNDSV